MVQCLKVQCLKEHNDNYVILIMHKLRTMVKPNYIK